MATSIVLARTWVEIDPNESTRNHVQALLDRREEAESEKQLASLFPSDGSRIGFGTAGLRSTMKPGPLGMNDLVIVQTTQGLARYCQEVQKSGGSDDENKKLLAVVGYDHRANTDLDLSSKSFAMLTKLAFQESGMDCILLEGYVATPILAFATTKLNAAVGIMVTASHNPKQDAGFKVYWSDGCQIRSPIDTHIAEYIMKPENLKPFVDYEKKLKEIKSKSGETQDVSYSFGLGDKSVTMSIADDYFNTIRQSGLITGQGARTDITKPKIAYSAMHGVGHRWAKRSVETFGLDAFFSVPEQQEPDHTFPTVSFPNPEEKGALDIATKFAEDNGCDIVLANDPDADRLAVAEKKVDGSGWITLTGDQIGTMLGHWIWESIGKHCGKPVAMCASTVSSKMLAAIAKVEGFYFEDTLTGFKWIGSRSVELGKEGYRSLFAYEEAIGFCCGDVVADKDGLTALGVMTELAISVYGNGNTLMGHMQSLYDKYGEFVSNNGYYFCYEPLTVEKIMNDMRNGGNYMKSVGPYEVESIRDLGPGYDSTTDDKKPKLPTSKTSPMITIRFKNGTVVQFRASGTEPKFKYYIELQGKPGIKREIVEQELDIMSKIVLEKLLRPKENGLLSSKL